MASIGMFAKDKCPVKTKMGEKDPKEWVKWCEDMEKYGKELAEAAKAKNADKVKTAATNLYSTCNNCHTIFRD
jgi:hypothetical protein